MASKKIELLRNSFNEGVTSSLQFRKEQLKNIFKMLQMEEDSFFDALKADLNKSKNEAMLTEVGVSKSATVELLHLMDDALAKKTVPKTMASLTDCSYIQKQPYGVVLVLSPWNFPVSLIINPLIGAIAAGNVVLVKPSEISSNVEKLFATLLPKYVDHRICQVYCGGVGETVELLKEKFDFICYTGSTAVGKIVYKAAAEHLTPVLLELGGKSPTYVDKSADLTVTANRIAWGKTLNSGQICVAPDYVLVHKEVSLDELVTGLKRAFHQFLGEDIKANKDYARIISEKHFERLNSLLKGTKGDIVFGGHSDLSERFFEPTIVTNVSDDDSLLSEELFGPILPIVVVSDEREAVAFINKRQKPLALYVFASDKNVKRYFEEKTSSGGLVFNGLVKHVEISGLPFGGVGESGIGRYHGKFSIDTFSHLRSCVDMSTNETLNYKVAYPPYTDSQLYWMSWVFPTKVKSSYPKSCTIL